MQARPSTTKYINQIFKQTWASRVKIERMSDNAADKKKVSWIRAWTIMSYKILDNKDVFKAAPYKSIIDESNMTLKCTFQQ